MRKAAKEDGENGPVEKHSNKQELTRENRVTQNALALAEQRRLEIEQKKKEKAVLEAQRVREAEERRRLEEELCQLQKENKMRTVLGDRLDLLDSQIHTTSESDSGTYIHIHVNT